MSAKAGTRSGVALMIGVGQYRKTPDIDPLPYATQDAKALARLFADPDICGFPREQVVVLTDQRAKRDPIVHRLSHWLPQQARGAELAVIFFAGHGMVHKLGADEQGYLLPYDADPEDIVTRGVAMSDVAQWIRGIEARAVLVLLDCCHAGKLLPHPDYSVRSPARDLRLRPALLQGLNGKGRFLIASCGEGQKSLEAPELRHGLFTYHLVQGIAGAGDRDGDGRVGVAELFNYVSAAVARDAREKFGTDQTPWTNSTWTDDVYISCPQAPPREIAGQSALEDRWRSKGPLVALREIDQRLDGADDGYLIEALRLFRKLRDPASVPAIFHCLAHPSEAVRERARKAMQALGWEQVTAAVVELARADDTERMGRIFDGLAALAAQADVVNLLDRLVVLLRGNLRNRAIALLERKQLALDLEKVAALFREKNSPLHIEKVLGAGLFTAAYLARDELTDLQVVVRVLRPELARQPLLRSQFLDLSRQAVRFVHQNLVLTRLAQAYADRNIYYTVRDYIHGATLREVLESGRKFEPLQVVKILRQVGEALTPLHELGLVHGGIKPSNIFLAREDRVILGDPSLPIPTRDTDLQRVAYDFRYAPPEMFRGGGVVGPAADYYALGCVAHELLYDAPPFVSDNHYELIARHERDPITLPERRDGLPLASQTLLLRLLAKDPTARFARLEDLLQSLDDWRAALQGKTAVLLPNVGSRPPQSAATPPSSVRLMAEESLARFNDANSIVPLNARSEFAMDTQSGANDLGQVSPGSLQSPGWPEIPGYEILEELGRGGMGVVLKAQQLALKRTVAIKMSAISGPPDSERSARFSREAHAVARLSHPNIVSIFDLGQVNGRFYFSMEFVEGGSLAHRRTAQPQSPRAAAELLRTLARAIAYAHQQGIIHRDLKPSNILLTAAAIPKITDFGLAKLLNEEMGSEDLYATHTGTVMGTPMYMSPEQARGDTSRIGPATDIYALGIILYQQLAGQTPFHGSTPMDMLYRTLNEEPPPLRKVQPGVPGDLEAICLNCLRKDPAQRYASAQALADDLGHFLEQQPILARPVRSGWRWLHWLFPWRGT